MDKLVAKTLNRFIAIIVRRRWPIILGFSLAVLALEILEHGLYSFYPIQRYLLVEVLLFNVFLPLSLGFTLSLQDSKSKLSHILTFLNLQVMIRSQLSQAKDWDDFAQTLFHISHAFLQVSSGMLTIFSEETGGYDLNWQWSQVESSLPRALSSSIPNQCPKCQNHSAVLQQKPPSNNCEFVQQAEGMRDIWCLRFQRNDDLVGWMHLYLDSKSPPTASQISLITSLVDEISLSIEHFGLIDTTKNQTKLIKTERKRLARYLHDSLAHDLAYICLRLDQILLENPDPISPALFHEMERIRSIANQSYEQLRESLAELQDETSKDIFIEIQEYADESADRANYLLEMTSYGDQKLLSSHLSRQIIMVVREAIRNIEKHAEARHVNVQFHWMNDSLELDIADDGKGFDLQRMKDTENHFGINMMKEIVEELNGQVSFCSVPTTGTQVKLMFPLK